MPNKTLVKFVTIREDYSPEEYANSGGTFDENAIYFFKKTHEIYKGSTLYGGNIAEVETLLSNYVLTEDLEADYITANDIAANYAQIEEGVITNAYIDVAKVNNLSSTYATIANLNATNADVANLEADTAKIHNLSADDLSAATSYIGTLTAGSVSAESVVASKGLFDDLNAGTVTANNIKAAAGYIGTIGTQALIADHATIGSLDSNYAQIENGYLKNAIVDTAVIADGAVTSEKVHSISANKITAGTIDASKINVTNLRADNLIVNRINGQAILGGYTAVNPNIEGYSTMVPANLGWYEIDLGQMKQTEDLTVEANKTYYVSTGNSVSIYDKETVDGMVENVNRRIDGAIEVYNGSVIPTTENQPYLSWYNTATNPVTDVRAEHVGNLYYVISSHNAIDPSEEENYNTKNPAEEEWYELSLEDGEYVLTEDTTVINGKTYYKVNPQDGYCYRFYYDSTSQSYDWVLIKDSDVTAALGKITELENFNVQLSHWEDATDEGVISVRNKFTTLSGRVDKVVKESVQCWCTVSSTSNAPSKPQSQVTSTDTSGNDWRLVVPAYSSTYPYYYYCWQYKYEDNSYGWSAVVYDQATTEAEARANAIYGTCSTTASTAAKIVTCNGFSPFTGARLSVKFTTASTAVAPTLTIKDGSSNVLLAEKEIWNNNVVASSDNPILWGANATLMFVYDGTRWVLESKPSSYSTSCSTGASTATKAPTVVAGALVVNGTTVTVSFSTANTYVTNAVKLNLSSTGAANIYRGNAVTSASNTLLWDAGTDLTFVRRGSGWYLSDNGARELADNAQQTADSNIQNSIMLWKITNNTNTQAKPYNNEPTTNRVDPTSTSTDPNTWTPVVPPYNSSYPYYHYCYQQQRGDDKYQWTTPVYDAATSDAMATAKATAGIFTTFEQTHNKTLVDTVDESSSAITTLTTTTQHGGINLLINTANPSAQKPVKLQNVSYGTEKNFTATYDNGIATLTDSATDSGERFVRWVNTNNSNGALVEDYENGIRSWTLSGYVRASLSTPTNTVEVRAQMNNGSNWLDSFTLTNLQTDTYHAGRIAILTGSSADWVYFAVKMTLANNLTMAGAYFSLQEYGTFTQGDTIEYKQLKLERGSIATPWSYAQDDITTISNTTNEVKQTADKNSSRISNLTTTLGSTVRNLLVGGVSPRGGGQRPTSDILEAIAPNTWYTYDTIATPVASLARTNDHSIKYQRTSDTSTNSGIVIPLVEPNIIAIGETLTLSFWYKGSKTSLGDCYLLYTAGNNQKQGGNWNGLVTDDQEWHRYEKTFTATSTNTTGDMYALLIAYNRVANDWLEIKDGTMMLERGDVATRMSLAETTIDQTANNILIKATETDTTAAQGGQHIIQSLINVAPEGVKISAQKIQIDGSAIFTAISDSVDTAITNKGYQTATEVESAIGDVKDMMTFFATCNTAAGTAIKDATIIDGQSGFTLKQGASVDVKFTNTNTVAVGNLKLRVNSSNENDAKSIKTMRNSSLTNLANAGVLAAGGTIHFVYDGTYWVASENYNNTYNLSQNIYSNVINTRSAITAESIIVGNGSGYAQAAAGVAFDLDYQILWSTVSGNNSSTISSGLYTSIQDRNLNTVHSFSTGTKNKTVYLVGTISKNTFTLADSYLTTTVTVPSSETETSPVTCYIPIGRLGNDTSSGSKFYFSCTERPSLYAYIDGGFRQVNPTDIIATQRIYYRASSAQSNLTGPTTWVTNNAAEGNTAYGQWNLAIPPLTTNKTSSSATKYLYLYSCEQRQRLDGTIKCTTVALDKNTTIIDGGNIITGTIDANALNVTSINNSGKLTIGSLDSDFTNDILNSNIKFGGNNLFKRADTLVDTTYWKQSNITTMLGGYTDPFGNRGAYLITPSNTSWYLSSINSTNLQLTDVGNEYTFSVWLRADTATTCKINVRYLETEWSDGSTATATTRRTVDVTTSWQRFVITGTLTAEQSATGDNCFWIGQSTTTPIYVYGIQAENGNKLSDFSVSYDDARANNEIQNISPMFSITPYIARDYWVQKSTNNVIFTGGDNGWVHCQCDNTNGSSVLRCDMTPMKVEDVKEGTDYTFLFEFKNNSSTASTNGARVYIVQRNNSQFWGSTISANLEGPNHNSSIYLAEVDTSNGIWRRRFTKKSEATTPEGSTTSLNHWTDNNIENITGFVSITVYVTAGDAVDFEMRVSIYEGIYMGDYKECIIYSKDASKTATNYITADSTGIKIHNAKNLSTYQHLTNSANTFYINDIDMANYSADTIRLGRTGNYNRVIIDTSGMTIYNAGTDVANYGSTIRLGKTGNNNRIIINDSGMTIYNAGNAVATYGQQTTFYEPNVTPLTEAATIDSNGINVKVGSFGNATNKIIVGTGTNSTNDSAIRYNMTTLNDTTHTDGFYLGTDGIALGGGVFKVTANGTLYANGANITDINGANITAGTISADQLAIGAVQVGGRNLLRRTANLTTNDIAVSRSTVVDGIIICTPTTSTTQAKFIVDYLTWDECHGKTYTLSFEARTTGDTTNYTTPPDLKVRAGYYPASSLNSAFASATDRYMLATLTSSLSSTTWTKYSITFTDTDMTTGTTEAAATGSYFSVGFGTSGSKMPLAIQHVKLEAGNKATDYTVAPEDTQGQVDSLAYDTQWLTFESTGDNRGLIIGASDGTANARLTSSELSFNYAGVSRASVGANGFVSERIQMGDVAWIWNDTEKCLYLKKVR